MDDSLKFKPMNSFPNTSFWSRLTDLKLHAYKLDANPKPIKASFSHISPTVDMCFLNLDANSFDIKAKDDDKQKNIHTHDFCGELILFNKLDDFKRFDKKTILDEYGRRIMESIVSGTALTNPSTLNKFVILAFADLKKYHYYYWFAFPAIVLSNNLKCHKIDKVTDLYGNEDMNDLTSCIVDRKFSSFAFIVEIGFENGRKTFNCRPFESLRSFRTFEKVLLGFCDPSHDSKSPGWPLRNLLAAWSYYTCATSISVLCWRQCSKNGVASFKDSIILALACEKSESSDVKTYGWEKNDHSQLAPRFLNLSRSMDPRRLADEALTLNLQLMRWRLIPELDLDTIFQTSCLIFGAGTLGCNVARCLLGWGIRNITLIDEGSVSFSNPVRQTLYNFEDCISSTGKSKAHVAVDALKKIFPNVNANAHQIRIPMPGHTVAQNEWERVKKDIELIDELIQTHDVCFLLFDSRESRWLPAALGSLHGKFVISAALGFDSYLIVRHGAGKLQNAPSSPNPPYLTGDALGCYFCSDVTAPGDTLSDRTLDQQCTVTRPGSSFVTSGLAVELMITTLQHPERHFAPALCKKSRLRDQNDSDENGGQFEHRMESCLGHVPHQIRGFLSSFEQFTPAVCRFGNCICCSRLVTEKLAGDDKFEFLFNVFNDPSTLEKMTGLEKLMNDENLDDLIAVSSGDESLKSV